MKGILVLQRCYVPWVETKMFKALQCFVFVVALLAVSSVIFPKDAQAVRVSVKRIIFENNKKSEVLTIINNTGAPKTYRLGWKKLRMDEKKSLSSIDEGEPHEDILWAEDMVRFAPRRITVPAGGSQQVRLLFRPPSKLDNAEYRAHLWIVSEGAPPKFEANPDSTKQEIKLAVQPAISLPVFVRHGDLSADVSIRDAKLAPSKDGLKISMQLTRDGNRSIYGDFDFTCADGARGVVLKQVRGVAVYPEINRRYLNYDLPLTEATTTSCNKVKVVYRADPDDAKYKGEVMAETTVTR